MFIYKNAIKNLKKNIVNFKEDSGSFVFNCNGMGIINININNIDLDNNFDEDDPDAIILIRLLARRIIFEKRKALKKDLNEELMYVA